MSKLHMWLMIAVMALVTALLRFLPFFIFGGHRPTPKIIEKLGRSLPFAIMGMLVVYCLKEMSFATVSGFLPMVLASLFVAITYIWKRNTLLSIISGTLCYMFLVQMVF